jgi:hypothetical protein
MNGFMAAPSVAHAEHHGAHKAGTHATGMCAWFCVAGQEVESSSAHLISRFQLVGWSESVSANPVLLLFSTSIFSRGPPVLSL